MVLHIPCSDLRMLKKLNKYNLYYKICQQTKILLILNIIIDIEFYRMFYLLIKYFQYSQMSKIALIY